MTKSGFMSSIIYPKLCKNRLASSTFGKLAHPILTKNFCRNTVLLPILVGRTFNVHNGRVFLRVLVSENIVGHKLGEFSQSRRRYFYKKGRKAKQKGKK